MSRRTRWARVAAAALVAASIGGAAQAQEDGGASLTRDEGIGAELAAGCAAHLARNRDTSNFDPEALRPFLFSDEQGVRQFLFITDERLKVYFAVTIDSCVASVAGGDVGDIHRALTGPMASLGGVDVDLAAADGLGGVFQAADGAAYLWMVRPSAMPVLAEGDPSLGDGSPAAVISVRPAPVER